MTYLSHSPLQQAIYETLTGDAALTALVSGIYDHVPQGTDTPFVTLGEANVREWSNAEKTGSEQQLSLRIFSRESGRKQAAIIMERIVTLLHNAAIAVTGCTLMQLQCTASSISLMNDGATYRGTLNFRALLRDE